MPSGKVIIIDDDAAVLESIEAMLATAGFEVTAFTSATRFLNMLEIMTFACVVTDVRMPEMSGLDLAERLAHAGRGDWPLIVISGHGDIPMAVSAMKAGASNFLQKPFAPGELVQAIVDAFEARKVVNVQSHAYAQACERLQTLSPREREVLSHLVNGASSKVTALVLGISPRTVDVFRSNILRKMQAPNIAALATWVGRGLAA